MTLLARVLLARVLLARVLGFGLELVQAVPRRVRVSLLFSLLTLLILVQWPELLLEVARLRVEPILDSVVESVEGLGSRGGAR